MDMNYWLNESTDTLLEEITNMGSLTLTASESGYSAVLVGAAKTGLEGQRIEVSDPDLRTTLARVCAEVDSTGQP